MGEMNPMVKTFNDAIAKSGIQIEMYRDDYRDEWKVKVDTSKHDAEVKADAIDTIIRALKNRYFCMDDLCTGEKSCSDCRVEYLEKLKEKANG